MLTHVAQWGNSMALRLPSNAIQQLGLKKGSQVEMTIEKNRLTIKPKRDLNELLSRITEDNLPDYAEFDDEPQGKELW